MAVETQWANREELPSNLLDCRLVLDNGCYISGMPVQRTTPRIREPSLAQKILSSQIKSKFLVPKMMMTFAHYRFKNCLKHKAYETGKLVLDVNEAYTSKTCSWTGEVKNNLGGAKVMVGRDGQRMDRDINGARGIFLRALGDTPALQACVVE